jgi:nitrogenase cofactor biosynthesis protein NifB
MATHYNEPVDVASTCLTEEGTVFGGEKNLIKGLDNLIRLYEPQVVAVSTTCLAETIGEDVLAMLKRYQQERPQLGAAIVYCPSPGYGGTDFEGWFAALKAVVSHPLADPARHDGINVITGPISPADTRALKELLDSTALKYTLLPDISENLDGPYRLKYNRLPQGGTLFSEALKMAGARATLELSLTVPARLSPGKFLEEHFGVPLIKLALPVGLRDTDQFLASLKKLGGFISPKLRQARGRFIDAMLDSHKQSAMGRAAFFGQPDLVYSLVRLAEENGLKPKVAAVGTTSSEFLNLVCQNQDFLLDSELQVIDGADFDDIEEAVVKAQVNVLVGSSDGRRLAEKMDLPLVRCGFPIHDRAGGQRIRTVLYEGATDFLDLIVNSIRTRQEGSYRALIKREFFDTKESWESAQVLGAGAGADVLVAAPALLPGRSIQEVPESACGGGQSCCPPGPKSIHPCFSAGAAHHYARLHLPVAKGCNISCRYCLRKFDCVSESRPGVTSRVLTPAEALDRFLMAKKTLSNLSVVGIAGPGDSLANLRLTLETLRLIRERDPEILFCVSTNGLLLPSSVSRLAELGVSHLTITINTLDPRVGAKLYRYVTYNGSRYEGQAGAAILLANQLAGLKAAADASMIIKINSVLVDGINNDEIEKVASLAASLGASLGNVMKHISVPGTELAENPVVSSCEHQRVVELCGKHLTQMRHCQQCRADAAGRLGEDLLPLEPQAPPVDLGGLYKLPEAAALNECQMAEPAGRPEECQSDSTCFHRQLALVPVEPAQTERTPSAAATTVKIAVASGSGTVVDRHFGSVGRFLVFESDGTENRLLEIKTLAAGVGCGRCGGNDTVGGVKSKPPEGFIQKMVEACLECDAVLAIRIGDSPRQKLAAKGVACFTACGPVDEGVRAVARRLLADRAEAGSIAV